MPRNGSGTYTLPSGNPVTTGSTISSTVQNNTMSDIATALTNSLAKDGQTTPTANLPMGGFKLTGLGAGSARTDSVSLANIQDGTGIYVSTVGGTGNAITLTPSPAISSYTAGQTFSFVASASNTGATTVNISGLGARDISKEGTTALVSGDINSGSLVWITYDGTRFQIGSPQATAKTGAVTSSGLTMATSRLLGRTTASTGAVEEITVGSGLTLSSGTLTSNTPSPSQITAALSANVSLNNTSNYFTGPTIAQGSTGTWFAWGTVTVRDATAGANAIYARLTDGTTVIASGGVEVDNGTRVATITLSGFIASPAGNLRIECRDATTVNGTIEFNFTGNSRDSHISAIRIA